MFTDRDQICPELWFQGKNINEETARLLQEGIEECVGWGDRDTQALLLMESAELEALRGKTQESVAVLQVPQPQKSWILLDLFVILDIDFGKWLYIFQEK